MNRSDLIRMLEGYNPTSYELKIVDELLEYIKTDDDCFERKHEEGAKHIAAATFVVNEKDETLFLWHKKLQRWASPGGHCDGNEDIIDVALTELEEETGLKNVEIEEYPLEIRRYDYAKEVFGYKKSIYNITFLVRINSNEQTPRICEPDKCGKLTWMSKQEALKEASIDDIYDNREHLIKKWIQR